MSESVFYQLTAEKYTAQKKVGPPMRGVRVAYTSSNSHMPQLRPGISKTPRTNPVKTNTGKP